MRCIVSSWFLILIVLVNTCLSQVIIREKVQIQPARRLITTSTASSVSYLSPPTFLTPAVGLPRVALPSNVTVEGTINFAPSQLEPRQWALLRLTGVGPAAIELHYIEKTIGGQLIERKGTFSGPVGVCGGGVPQLQTFDGSVGNSSIQFDNSGNQVTYTLTGGVRQGPQRFTVPVPATVTSSASAQPGFELAQWAIGPSQDSLVGSGSATLTITALNASGDQYLVCTTSNADATVTVSIQAQGEYAYLRGPDGQEGSSITIPFLSGDGFSAVKTCSVVLDESRGSIPAGRDVATITVTGGATATKQIVLRRGLDHFFVEMGPPEVDFGSTSFAFVTAVNAYGNGVELADETIIRLTMDQPENGTFLDMEGNERDTVDVSYYDAYVGNIQFFATGVNPEEDFKNIEVTASTTIDGLLTTGSGQVVVKAYKPRCAVVVFDLDTLAPGDTASLSFQAPEGEDGFAEDQRFVVHIVASKGTLLLPDSTTGNDLTGLSGQMRYIAPDSSLTVQLIAKTSPPSGPPVIISSAGGPGEVTLGSSGASENAAAALENVCVASEVVVRESALDHFAVTVQQDTIAFTEATKIFVQAKDVNDQNIELESTTLLKFSVTANEEYGTFIDKNGDTLKTASVRLNNVAYGDAQGGLIRFAAVKKNPIDAVLSKVLVNLESDETKKGENEIPVLEQTLRIVMEAPHEVRPEIPTENNNEAFVMQRRKSFEVRITRGGKPVTNHPFRLRTDYVRGSGGHDHDDTRNTVRADNNDNYGYFTAGESTTRRRPLDEVTGTVGRFPVAYNASIWGDTLKIYLESRESMLLKDSVSVVERVQGLMLLPDLPNFYSRIGGTCNHHGPSDRLPPGSPCQTPDNNHWGTEDVVNAVFSIALGWLLELPSEPPLFVNDMSLPFGGLFDMNGNWSPGHTLHRTGKDVDVRTEFLNPQEPRLGIVIREPRNSIEASAVSGNPLFEQLCLSWSARKIEIHGKKGTQEEHYHLYF